MATPYALPLTPYRLLLAAVIVAALLSTPAHADPRTDYMLHCQGCHGPDGAGAPGAAPSFRGEVARFLSVKDGREYLVRVPGTAQSALDDARTAALLNWLLQTFDPGHVPSDFRPFRADEVQTLRQAPLTDVVTVRRQLVQALDGR